MTIKDKIGNRIKELRNQRKLSQESLANIAEVDRTYMTSVENGRRNISIVTLEKIMNALGVTFTEFFNAEMFEK
jgi:transcriptional regulator with XRE-family HTH domain